MGGTATRKNRRKQQRKIAEHLGEGAAKIGNAPRTTGGHWVRDLTEARERTRKLGKVPLLKVVADCPEIGFLTGTYLTVGEVLKASDTQVRGITGFGPKRRAAVHAYLTGVGLSPTWKP